MTLKFYEGIGDSEKIDELQRQLKFFKEDARTWKLNHDEMVRRNSILRTRTDIPLSQMRELRARCDLIDDGDRFRLMQERVQADQLQVAKGADLRVLVDSWKVKVDE